jgi:hypothetical protein
VNVNAVAGNLNLTVAGPLNIVGGPGPLAGQGTIAYASGNKAKASVNVYDGVQFNAHSNITVTQNGGDLSILGGSFAGASGFVGAKGASAAGNLNVDNSTKITALGTVTFTGADNVTIAGGALAAIGPGVGQLTVLESNGGSLGSVAQAKINSSVTLTGTLVTVNHSGSLTHPAGASGSSSGVSFNNKLTGAVKHTPTSGTSNLVHTSTLTSGTSFGASRKLGQLQSTLVAGQKPTGTAVDYTSGSLHVASSASKLGMLVTQGLVTHLVTLAAPGSRPVLATDAVGYVHQAAGQGKSLELGAATLFTPAHSGSGYR